MTYDSVNKRVLSSQSGENNMKYIKGYNLTKDGNHILLPDKLMFLNSTITCVDHWIGNTKYYVVSVKVAIDQR